MSLSKLAEAARLATEAAGLAAGGRQLLALEACERGLALAPRNMRLLTLKAERPLRGCHKGVGAARREAGGSKCPRAHLGIIMK